MAAIKRVRRRSSTAGNDDDFDDWLAPRPEPPLKAHLGEFEEANDVVADAVRLRDDIGLAYATLRDRWADPEYFDSAVHRGADARKDFAWMLTKLLRPVHDWIAQMETAAREWHRRHSQRHGAAFGEASQQRKSVGAPVLDDTADVGIKEDDGVVVFAAAAGDVSASKLRALEVRLLMLHRRVTVRCAAVGTRIEDAAPAPVSEEQRDNWRDMAQFRASLQHARVRQTLGSVIENFVIDGDIPADVNDASMRRTASGAL
jgi:hypothetical protein